MDIYNKKLFGRFKNELSFAKTKMNNLDAFVLYFKLKDKVTSIDDVKVLGFLTTKPLSGEYHSVYQSVAVPGLGNILYAFSTMELAKGNGKICCNQEGDLRDDAQALWYTINNNPNYMRSDLPRELICPYYVESERIYEAEMEDISNEEYLDLICSSEKPLSWNMSAYTCDSDYGFNLASANYAKSRISDELLDEIAHKGDEMFWVAFDEDAYEIGDLDRIALAENDYSELERLKPSKDSCLSM